MGALCWDGKGQRVGVLDQGTRRDEMEGRGQLGRRVAEDPEGPGVGELDWTSETCGDQQSLRDAARTVLERRTTPYRVTCVQTASPSPAARSRQQVEVLPW